MQMTLSVIVPFITTNVDPLITLVFSKLELFEHGEGEQLVIVTGLSVSVVGDEKEVLLE